MASAPATISSMQRRGRTCTTSRRGGVGHAAIRPSRSRVGYDRQLSARTTFGARLAAQRTDYKGPATRSHGRIACRSRPKLQLSDSLTLQRGRRRVIRVQSTTAFPRITPPGSRRTPTSAPRRERWSVFAHMPAIRSSRRQRSPGPRSRSARGRLFAAPDANQTLRCLFDG